MNAESKSKSSSKPKIKLAARKNKREIWQCRGVQGCSGFGPSPFMAYRDYLISNKLHKLDTALRNSKTAV